MNHVGVVRVGERIGDVAKDVNRLSKGKAPSPPQSRAERFPLDVRHDVEQQGTGRARVEERQDMWMLEVSGEPDLREEPLHANPGSDLGLQHLNGDVALVFQIVRKIDDSHASGAQLAHEPIA
jgi:hypothetical protein